MNQWLLRQDGKQFEALQDLRFISGPTYLLVEKDIELASFLIYTKSKGAKFAKHVMNLWFLKLLEIDLEKKYSTKIKNDFLLELIEKSDIYNGTYFGFVKEEMLIEFDSEYLNLNNTYLLEFLNNEWCSAPDYKSKMWQSFHQQFCNVDYFNQDENDILKIMINSENVDWTIVIYNFIEKISKKFNIDKITITKENDFEILEYFEIKISGKTEKIKLENFDCESFKRLDRSRITIGVFNEEIDNEFKELVKFENSKLYTSKYNGNIYLFGYDVSKLNNKGALFTWLQNKYSKSTHKEVDTEDLYKFLSMPIELLRHHIPLNEISCVVYPNSQRCNLVQNMISILTASEIEASWAEIEAIKKLPQEVIFDYDKFLAEFPANRENEKRYAKEYKDKMDSINKLVDKIRKCGYFSIADEVPTRYRKFISNFLYFKDENSVKVFEKLSGDKILIVDDIFTTGATITELLKIIHAVNSKCEVYIFTLLGRNPRL